MHFCLATGYLIYITTFFHESKQLFVQMESIDQFALRTKNLVKSRLKKEINSEYLSFLEFIGNSGGQSSTLTL